MSKTMSPWKRLQLGWFPEYFNLDLHKTKINYSYFHNLYFLQRLQFISYGSFLISLATWKCTDAYNLYVSMGIYYAVLLCFLEWFHVILKTQALQYSSLRNSRCWMFSWKLMQFNVVLLKNHVPPASTFSSWKLARFNELLL